MRKNEDGRHKHRTKYTDEDLLSCLKNFYLKNERVPTRRDFTNSSGYPSFSTYRRRFGGWINALKKIDEIHEKL